MKQFTTLALTLFAASLTLLHSQAQTHSNTARPHIQPLEKPSITYTTEFLWNMGDGYANWINILNAYHEIDLWSGGTLDIDLLAVNNLRNSQGKGGIAENLHIFSAIEDESCWLSLFELGVTQDFGISKLFIGVRNINKDYFTSPWNSIFTSSVGGLYPSISDNFPISDSPLSAMCLHSEMRLFKGFIWRSSLYNGVASNRWDEVFRIRPNRDGLFTITEFSYSGREGSYVGNYHVGFAFGHTPLPEEQRSQEEPHKKYNRESMWLLVEQPLYIAPTGKTLALLLHGGWAPKSACDLYGAMGFIWRGLLSSDDYVGLLYNRSLYATGYETALELTYSYPTDFGTIQPALHRVYTHSSSHTIAMGKIVFDF